MKLLYMSNESVSPHQTTPTPVYEDVLTCSSRKENRKNESLELSKMWPMVL